MMIAFGSTIAGGLARFPAVVRALAFLLIAALTLPSIAAADHVHTLSAAPVLRVAVPDAPIDAVPDCCPLCHVNCACHAGLPAVQSIASFDRSSTSEPFFSADLPQPSTSSDRLKRPPRA